MPDRLITNNEKNTLRQRLDEYLPHANAVDILVGYFYTHGFHYIQEAFQNAEKIRILVGMAAQKNIGKAYNYGEQLALDEFSDSQVAEMAAENSLGQLRKSSQEKTEFDGLWRLIEMAKSGQLEIRAYRKQPLHAKMYVMHTPNQMVQGGVVTGSSNLTKNGLEANLEINVFLSDTDDYREATNVFEGLWQDSVDISEILAEKVENESWLKPATPQEIFYRAAYEYVGGSQNLINAIEEDEQDIGGFKQLTYQQDAVNQAVDILKKYNGVFLADVVGLGKTYIAAMLLRRLRNLNQRGGALVIAPPALMDEWKHATDTLSNGGVFVRSRGDIKNIRDELVHRRLKDANITTVVIDESHKFRNVMSEQYSDIQEICQNKQVIMLSATPQTKSIEDLRAQISLFARNEDFIDLLEGKTVQRFFDDLRKETDSSKKAAAIDPLLRNIMIRRTRREIQDAYQDDLRGQDINFPKALDPELVSYQFSTKESGLLTEAEQKLEKLKLARFKPHAYIKEESLEDQTLDDLKRAGQQLSGINRILTFKRLESSVEAARNTLQRQLEVNQSFIKQAHQTKTMPFGIDNKTLIASLDDVVEDEYENGDTLPLKTNENYSLEKFKAEELFNDIEADIEVLKEIISILQPITPEKDGKLRELLNLLRNDLSDTKVLIFSESFETCKYLKEQLQHKLGEEVGLGHGGLTKSEYEQLKKRFAPKANDGERQNSTSLRLLVATDSFSEGVNLQDANCVVNYDLPWNPIKIIQRVGRVNRIGSNHEEVHSYNFFPGSEIDEHLRHNQKGTLKERVQQRISDFHAIIGDDTKHLSSQEEPEPRQYFRIVSKSADDIDGEKRQYSYSELIKMLRRLRQEDPNLYERIQSLPTRAWTARNHEQRSLVALAKRAKHLDFYEIDVSNMYLQRLDAETAFSRLDAGADEQAIFSQPPQEFGQALQHCESAFSETNQQKVTYSKITPTSYKGKIISKIKEVYVPSLPEDTRTTLNAYLYGFQTEQFENRGKQKEVKRALNNTQTAAEVAETLQRLLLYPYSQSVERQHYTKPEVLLSCLFWNN